ncbi:hypothetical protein NQ314_013694, partial [Rhamnusium bicolor]
MWRLVLVFIIKTVTSSLFVTDQCVNICKDADLPPLELENYEQVVCQRGCRFFNIIKFKDEVRINTTKRECHISCEESYIVKEENEICQTGCNLMGKEQEVRTYYHYINKTIVAVIFILDFGLSFLIEAESSIVLASPDREIEFDLMSDPSIKSQLEIGFNVDYKIPEAHIRTMPIEITEEEITVKESGDWLDCASRNSVFLLKKRGSHDENVDVDIPDDKLILENEEIITEKDPSLLEKDPTLFNTELIFLHPQNIALRVRKFKT